MFKTSGPNGNWMEGIPDSKTTFEITEVISLATTPSNSKYKPFKLEQKIENV